MARYSCLSLRRSVVASSMFVAIFALLAQPAGGLGKSSAPRATPQTYTVNYFVGDPDPDPIMVDVTSSAGAVPFSATGDSLWLTVTQNSPTTPATLTITVHPAGLGPGTWNGVVTLSQFGVATNYIGVTLVIQVFQPVDRLILSNTALTFRAADGNQPMMTQSFRVESSGQNLEYTVSVSSGAAWLTADATTPPPVGWHRFTPATLRVFANAKGLQPGTYKGSVQVSATRATNSPQTVAVTLVVGPPPEIRCSPGTLTFQYQIGSQPPASQTIAVSNTSTPLNFSVSAVTPGGNWLSFSPGSGTTPVTLSAAVSADNVSAGTYSGTIMVEEWAPGTSTCKIPVSLVVAPDIRPKIASQGVVNAASFTEGFSPGSWITIFGENLSTTAGTGRSWRSDEIVGGVLPVSLDGTSVRVNGKPAPIAFVSARQLNVQAPDDEARGTVTVEVTTPTGTAQASANLQTFSPALFVAGKGLNGAYVAGIHADGSAVGPAANQASPAHPGEVVMLFGTGFGPATPSRPAGKIIDPAPLASSFTVTIGGLPAEALYGGIVGPGLYQFNVRIPALATGEHSVVISVGGVRTGASVVIPVSD